MMLLIGILLAGLLAIIYNINNIKEYMRYRKLFNKLPGPKTHPIFGNIPDLLCDEVTLFKKVRFWGQKHYPVYRLSIGPFHAANVSSPQDFEAIAGSIKNIKKSPWYKFLHLWIGEGLATSTGMFIYFNDLARQNIVPIPFDKNRLGCTGVTGCNGFASYYKDLGNGSKWQSRRKIITPAFNVNILQQFVGAFTKQTDQLVQVLREECHNPYVNVIHHLSQFTLNVMNETSMGVKLSLENEEDASYCNAIIQVGKIITHRLTRPWLFFNNIFYNLTALGHQERGFINIINNFTRKVIGERWKVFQKLDLTDEGQEEMFKRKKKLVLMDVLLNAKVNSTMNDEDIIEEVNTFTVAGYDTSSTAISFILMLLAQHKDIQDTILQEINNVIGDPKAEPTYNNLQELKFMERCIKEGMRLYPPVPHIGRTLDVDVKTSNGYVLPKGAMAQIFIFDIHRNPNIWPNPDKFDPDRFLPENSEGRHPFAYVPFSIGPRNCIGQKFAMLEIKTALCGIIRNFVVEPVDTPENIILVPYILLSPKNHTLRVKLVPRENI